ncbi:MAG TPA: flagellar protein FlgN [Verrucomicrobiae bacterium]|nr:flagellar protein FlgN [Verrucomicrobiae bacterium]
MNDSLRILIEALREELKHYGEMLALLDRQQDLVVARAADEILDTVAAINAQSAAIHAARNHRENCRRSLAREWRLPENTPLTELALLLPADYRPLIDALVEENNSLLLRVQQRARQNHLLLNRSMELMQRLISTLLPVDRSTMYSGAGALFAPSLPSRPLYEAVG